DFDQTINNSNCQICLRYIEKKLPYLLGIFEIKDVVGISPEEIFNLYVKVCFNPNCEKKLIKCKYFFQLPGKYYIFRSTHRISMRLTGKIPDLYINQSSIVIVYLEYNISSIEFVQIDEISAEANEFNFANFLQQTKKLLSNGYKGNFKNHYFPQILYSIIVDGNMKKLCVDLKILKKWEITDDSNNFNINSFLI